MRTISIVILTLTLCALAGCGGRDESPQQPAEPQETAAAPAMDLHSAVVIGNLDLIRQHIKAGSDLNVLEPSRASTPLITAAALGRTEAAKILIDAGADLNYRNNDGSTALHTAAFFCHIEIVEALLAKGADKTLKNNGGRTAYDIVTIPFEMLKGVYDAIGTELRPAGLVLDYDRIKAARPGIAEMLK